MTPLSASGGNLIAIMKNALNILAIFIFLFSCADKNNNIETEVEKSKTIKTKEKKVVTETVYQTQSFIVIGDSTIDETKIYTSWQKFEPFVYFDDFKVPIEKNKKQKLDLESNSDGKSYSTNIRNAYKNENANFAGHYTFLYWGCGSTCAHSKIINRRNGKIYDAPETMLGYDFRPNSRMLVVNPPDSSGYFENSHLCRPEIYILDELTHKFVQRKPGLQ